jgi:hypothetical protein
MPAWWCPPSDSTSSPIRSWPIITSPRSDSGQQGNRGGLSRPSSVGFSAGRGGRAAHRRCDDVLGAC